MHHYLGSGNIESSGAILKFYGIDGIDQINAQTAKSDTQESRTYWNVLKLEPSGNTQNTHEVIIVNQIMNDWTSYDNIRKFLLTFDKNYSLKIL